MLVDEGLIVLHNLIADGCVSFVAKVVRACSKHGILLRWKSLTKWYWLCV